MEQVIYSSHTQFADEDRLVVRRGKFVTLVAIVHTYSGDPEVPISPAVAKSQHEWIVPRSWVWAALEHKMPNGIKDGVPLCAWSMLSELAWWYPEKLQPLLRQWTGPNS